MIFYPTRATFSSNTIDKSILYQPTFSSFKTSKQAPVFFNILDAI